MLLGVLALVKAAAYYLQRYELTFSTRGVVERRHLHRRQGAAARDQPADAHLARRRRAVHRQHLAPGLGAARASRSGLWAFVAVVAGTIYPAFIQRFLVQPAESTKERPYIERNIEASRAALGLDKVDDEPTSR